MVEEKVDEPLKETPPIVLEIPVSAKPASDFGLHLKFVLKPGEYLFCRGVAAALAELGAELSDGTPIYDASRMLRYLLQQSDAAMPKGKGTVALSIPAPMKVAHTNFPAKIDMKLGVAECCVLKRMAEGLRKRRATLANGNPIFKPTQALKYLLQLAMETMDL